MATVERAKVMYDGQSYTVRRSEVRTLFQAMNSSTPVRVDMTVGREVLTLVVGAGIPVAVITPNDEQSDPQPLVL